LRLTSVLGGHRRAAAVKLALRGDDVIEVSAGLHQAPAARELHEGRFAVFKFAFRELALYNFRGLRGLHHLGIPKP
jgi:hypothetical protein